jgi:hypothetical protein
LVNEPSDDGRGSMFLDANGDSLKQFLPDYGVQSRVELGQVFP